MIIRITIAKKALGFQYHSIPKGVVVFDFFPDAMRLVVHFPQCSRERIIEGNDAW